MKKLLATTALVVLSMSANAAYVQFKVGDTLTFRNPYKTGCPTIEMADAVSCREKISDYEKLPPCWTLLPDKPYEIVEVQQYNGNDFYRISLSNGNLMWTYIFSSRDVHEAIQPGTMLTLHSPNYACSSVNLMKMIATSQSSLPDLLYWYRDQCYTLKEGSRYEVQEVHLSHNNYFRFACVAPYRDGVPFSKPRSCFWMRID